VSAGVKIALCLPGGGATGAMYQIGVLAALEDALVGFDANALHIYVGVSSGASVAAALAGGRPVGRIYRAFLDPADTYFPLERRHLFQIDRDEWRRVVVTAGAALRRAGRSVLMRAPPTNPAALWEEFDRLNDSLPAGIFSLNAYERFLAAFFERRGVPNTFAAMPRPLRIVSHELDSGALAVFGAEPRRQVPVSRACVASMALPPLFSPVRVGDVHYVDAGAAQVAHLDVALAEGADVLVVVNPMVPVRATTVPTGHGRRRSVRDKGAVWVMHQVMRMAIHEGMREACRRISAATPVLLVEPDPMDGILFMYNPASFGARRSILEHAYRTTRSRILGWLSEAHPAITATGWTLREGEPERGRSEPPPR
jgi:NTE family protein